MKLSNILGALPLLLMCMGTARAQTIKPTDKVLVAYYSRSGNTREIAKQIRQASGADIFEIIPEQDYPSDYRETTTLAKKEISEGYHPALKNKIGNLADYQVVFVGSPCWWGTIASPVASFLNSDDFSGKKIIPFMTHGGSGLGHSESDIKKAVPQAEVIDGRAFWGNDVQQAAPEVSQWLKGLKND